MSAARGVLVVGAGIDVALGLPMVNDLASALALFVDTEGNGIDRALRDRIPNVKLSLAKVGGDAGDELIARLFESPEDLVPKLRAIQRKVSTTDDPSPVGAVLEAVCVMADRNRVPSELATDLAKITGETHPVGAAETVFDPYKLILTPLVRNAVRTTFQRILLKGSLSEEDRSFLEEVVAAISNIEDVLAWQFARFSQSTILSDRRTYLYLAWLIWAFIHLRSIQALPLVDDSWYTVVSRIDVPTITFNYTNFFSSDVRDRLCHFHGTTRSYLRAESRTVFHADPEINLADDSAKIADLMRDHFRLDVANGMALDLPGIVPPLSFKPIMSREQLLTWAHADQLLQDAKYIVVAGYSFSQADEHFNSLLRATPSDAQITLINPDLVGSMQRLQDVLGLAQERPTEDTDDAGHRTLSIGRLSAIGSRAEEVLEEQLRQLLGLNP